ncbi:MAG: nucleoside diphosphate kinase regulator [Pseudomonadota bacterium]
MAANSITLSETDYARLTALVNSGAVLAEALEQEIERATILPDRKLPKDVVSMFSTVQYRNAETNAINSVTLVYPAEADVNAAKVSVLAPIGAALIGLRVGHHINWALPNAKTVRLEVIGVTQSAAERQS